jgi:hypothetical protein
MLIQSKDPATAPPAIVKAIEGSHYEITLGAPLDLLAGQQREYADKTDAEKEKMLKVRRQPLLSSYSSPQLLQKAAEDKQGGEAIRNASLLRSRRTAAQRTAQEDSEDDDVIFVETRKPVSVAAPVSATPIASLKVLVPARADSWSPPHPVNLLHHKLHSDDDSDIEITGYNPAPFKTSTNAVVIKAEPTVSEIPAASTTTKPATKKGVKTETPLTSIPRTSRKGSSSKRAKGDDSDIENSPPTVRKTKRVRRGDSSFDLQDFLVEERKHRTDFETNLLQHVRQSTAEFRKGAENTQAFQTEFLGFLRGVFPAKD